jgi:predicted DNA-binding transcriptional regulator AlpA
MSDWHQLCVEITPQTRHLLVACRGVQFVNEFCPISVEFLSTTAVSVADRLHFFGVSGSWEKRVQFLSTWCLIGSNLVSGFQRYQTPACKSVVVQFMKESCQMSVQIVSKTVVSVAEMARMVGLSRARFYQLVAEGIFPSPIYCVHTRRPFFSEEMQQLCTEVRKRNCGVNGKPILFYSARHPLVQSKPVNKPKTEPKQKNQYADLLDGLRALGLEVTPAQIEPVIKELFPAGNQNMDSGEVIRRVFLRMKRQNSTDNVGR